MGAITQAGWRARALWGICGLFGVLSLAYLAAALTDHTIMGAVTVWSLTPVIAVGMAILVAGGREPRKPIPKLSQKPAVLNPAITVETLNGIVGGATELEAQRKLAAFASQMARIKGRVTNVTEHRDCVDVGVSGVGFNEWDHPRHMLFRKDQADALEVIKPDDWIEFVGRIVHHSTYGWALSECQLIGRAEPPKAPRRRKAPNLS